MLISQDELSDYIQSNKHSEALKLIIKQAANVGRKHPDREHVADLMLKVLLNVKSSDIDTVVSTLEIDEIDVLMRYIYHGFEKPVEGSSAHLLTWHGKVCNRGGVGSIVRVLTEH